MKRRHKNQLAKDRFKVYTKQKELENKKHQGEFKFWFPFTFEPYTKIRTYDTECQRKDLTIKSYTIHDLY